MALFIFGGQTTSMERNGAEMRKVAETIREAAARCDFLVEEVHLCFPPETTWRRWAVYEPTEAEVATHGGCWWTAERATTTVPRLAFDLYSSASEPWRLLDEAVRRRGQVLLCGFSNGAIVATEYATTHPERVRGLLLLSGLPASSQQRSVATGHKTYRPRLWRRFSSLCRRPL